VSIETAADVDEIEVVGTGVSKLIGLSNSTGPLPPWFAGIGEGDKNPDSSTQSTLDDRAVERLLRVRSDPVE